MLLIVKYKAKSSKLHETLKKYRVKNLHLIRIPFQMIRFSWSKISAKFASLHLFKLFSFNFTNFRNCSECDGHCAPSVYRTILEPPTRCLPAAWRRNPSRMECSAALSKWVHWLHFFALTLNWSIKKFQKCLKTKFSFAQKLTFVFQQNISLIFNFKFYFF